MATTADGRKILTGGQVAQMFKVDVKTVTRWEKAGKLSSFRTLGEPGHRRFYEDEVLALIAATEHTRTEP